AEVKGRKVRMALATYKYLQSFMEHQGETVSPEQLYIDAHPDCTELPEGYIKTVSVHVSNLRKRLARGGIFNAIETVIKAGYRLNIPTSPSESGITPDGRGEGKTEEAFKATITTSSGTITINEAYPNFVWVDGERVIVTSQGYTCLNTLMRGNGKIITPEDLSRALHPECTEPQKNSMLLRTVMSQLRKTIGQTGNKGFIKTVRSLGFRMDIPPLSTD